MLRSLALAAIACLLLVAPAAQAKPAPALSAHSLFVWAGDRDKKGNDFLLVIDVDPGSAHFGRMVTALETDQKTVRPHHTEYTMPASGMLFANDHDAGRSFILDVRNPLKPSVVTSLYRHGRLCAPTFIPPAAQRPCVGDFPARPRHYAFRVTGQEWRPG